MVDVQKTLNQIRAKASTAKNERMSDINARIIVGTATCGVSAGARSVVDAFNEEIKSLGIHDAIVTETGCSGRCDLEPLTQVVVDGEPPVLYYHVTPEKARRIVRQHIQNNDPILEWAIT